MFRAWLNGPNQWRFKPWYVAMVHVIYRVKETLVRDWVLGAIHYFLGLFLGIQVFYIIYEWICEVSNKTIDSVEAVQAFL